GGDFLGLGPFAQVKTVSHRPAGKRSEPGGNIALDAAVGCSVDAADAGWSPVARLVPPRPDVDMHAAAVRHLNSLLECPERLRIRILAAVIARRHGAGLEPLIRDQNECGV